MSKPKTRYCVRANKSRWQIWDRKMNKWWGQLFDDIPHEILNKLNTGKRSEIGSPWKKK